LTQTKILYIMLTSTDIKAVKKAVNQAKFNPTAERKANALKLLTELMEAVTNLEEVAPAPKRKPKRKATKRKSRNQKLEESQAKQNTAENFIPDAVAEVNHLPEYSELRSMGYSVEDAVRYVQALMQGAPEVA
jgi:superfamily I DNA and/or RNA helicase